MELQVTSFAQSINSPLMLSELSSWSILLVLSSYPNSLLNYLWKKEESSLTSLPISTTVALFFRLMPVLQKLEWMLWQNIWQLNTGQEESELLAFALELLKEHKDLIDFLHPKQEKIIPWFLISSQHREWVQKQI